MLFPARKENCIARYVKQRPDAVLAQLALASDDRYVIETEEDSFTVKIAQPERLDFFLPRKSVQAAYLNCKVRTYGYGTKIEVEILRRKVPRVEVPMMTLSMTMSVGWCVFFHRFFPDLTGHYLERGLLISLPFCLLFGAYYYHKRKKYKYLLEFVEKRLPEIFPNSFSDPAAL
jgi:hypothetical protein